MSVGPTRTRRSVTRRGSRGQTMRRLLDTETNRAGVLAQFVAELGPDDEKVLAALLEDTTDDPPTA